MILEERLRLQHFCGRRLSGFTSNGDAHAYICSRRSPIDWNSITRSSAGSCCSPRLSSSWFDDGHPRRWQENQVPPYDDGRQNDGCRIRCRSKSRVQRGTLNTIAGLDGFVIFFGRSPSKHDTARTASGLIRSWHPWPQTSAGCRSSSLRATKHSSLRAVGMMAQSTSRMFAGGVAAR